MRILLITGALSLLLPAVAQARTTRVLVIGASISKASYSYAHHLDRYCPTVVVARNGHQTGWMLKQLRKRTDLQSFSHLVILGGINDINGGRVRQASRNLWRMYHIGRRAGLKVVAITLPPWKGWPSWTLTKHYDTIRLNQWIRALNGQAVDQVIDLYLIAADRRDPARLDRRFDSGDHLHPGPLAHRHLLAWAYHYTCR